MRGFIIIVYLVSTVLLSKNIYSQKLHHQMIATTVGSKSTDKGLIISQSIGQLALGGTYSSPNFIVQQGFQQSARVLYQESLKYDKSIVTKVYPNPFKDYVNFKFSEPLKDKLTIKLFNMAGKLVISKVLISVSNSFFTMEFLDNLPDGNYIVHLSSSNYKYSTTIIKIK